MCVSCLLAPHGDLAAQSVPPRAEVAPRLTFDGKEARDDAAGADDVWLDGLPDIHVGCEVWSVPPVLRLRTQYSIELRTRRAGREVNVDSACLCIVGWGETRERRPV